MSKPPAVAPRPDFGRIRGLARILAGGLLLALAPLPVSPERPGEPAGAELEVRVVDDQARPVLDLSPSDFEVFDRDRELEVVGVRGPELRRQHLLAILVEPRYLSAPLRSRFLSGLDAFLRRRLTAGDEALVVSLGERVEVLAPPTNDPERLREALERVGEAAGRAESLVDRAESNRELRRSAQALREVLRALAGASRPVVALYVTRDRGGVSSSGDEERPTIALRETGDPTPSQNSRYIQYVISAPALPPRLLAPAPDLEPLVRAANAGGVSIYPLRLPPPELALAANASFDVSGGDLQELAERTGGQVLDSRQLDGELKLLEAYLDGAYTLILRGVPGRALAGSPTMGEPSQGSGPLRVSVARDAARSLYSGDPGIASDQVRLENRALYVLHLGIAENPLGIELEVLPEALPEEGREARAVTVQIAVPAEQVRLEDSSQGARGELSLCLAVRGPTGGRSAFHHFRLPLELATVDGSAEGSFAFAWRTRLLLGAGRHTLVLAVRDEGSGRISALWREVRPEAAGEGRALLPGS